MMWPIIVTCRKKLANIIKLNESKRLKMSKNLSDATKETRISTKHKDLVSEKKIVLKSSSEFTDRVDETENSSLSSSRHVKFPNYFIQNVRF